MVTTLLKTSLREIRQSLGRYLAILAIVGLGVGFFAGLRTCQPSMAATGVDYLEKQRMFDFRLLSTLGFTEEDVAFFADMEGIRTAQGAVYTDFLTEIADGEELVLKAHSLTDGVNLPALQAGRMPQAPNECLGDVHRFSEDDLGRVLRVSDNNDEDTRELLRCGEYTVVGLAMSPYYLNYQRGTSSIGSGTVSGFVYIPEDGFDFEAYYEIFLTVEDPAGTYSQAYRDQIDAVKPEIESALESRAALRYTTIYNDAMDEIRDAETEISDGWEEYHTERADAEQELADAHRELTDGEKEYADGVKDYEQGKRDYADGVKEYEDGQKEIADAEQEIADAEQELADAEQELADAEQELADAESELADARKELDDGWQDYEQGKLDAARELADAHKKLTDGEEEYADGEREYTDGLRKLEDSEDELAGAEKQIRDGERELADGERELADAWAQIVDAQKQLNDAETQLASAERQLEEGEQSYTQLQQLYTSTEQLAQGIGAGMGMSLDAGTLIGYLESGAVPELNGAVDMALQGSGSSTAQLVAGWRAAESQLGMPLTAAAVSGLRATLDESRKEYQAGLAEYESGLAEYRSGLAEYQEGEAQIMDARRELRDGKAELEDGRRQLEDARAELADARKKLDDARQELDDGWQEYYEGAAEAQEKLDDAHRELLDGETEYADGLEEYQDGLRKYQDGVKDFQDGQKELADGRRELADALKELADAQKKLADARDDLAKAPGGLADARQELDDGWRKYEDGRAEADAEFADAEEELTDAERKLADAYEDLRALKHATTYTLTRNENVGYVCFENDTSIIEAISVVFPVFFFLVAALVCMTTMTRMVDEQRTQIGVLKALGYSNGQIMGKYLFYSGSAALVGTAAGYAIGSRGLPWVIWVIYGIIYGFAPLKHVFLPGLMLVSFAAALLCSMGATYLSCRIELGRQTAELLRPKTPRAGRRVFLEYITPVWKRLGFLYKVSVRNVLRYRSRLVMMVLGIGGCTALLVTGFGIRDSIQHVADYQFDEIQLFDYAVTFRETQTEQSAEEYLARHGWPAEDGRLVYSGSIDVLAGGISKSVYMNIPLDGSLERFVDLHSGDVPVDFPGLGEVVLTVGLAENMGISVGDAVMLRDEDYGTLDVTVSGIADNYAQNYIYLSAETYQDQFDEVPDYNTVLVRGHEGADRYEEGALLLDDDDVGSVDINQATRDQVNNMLSSLDYIVVVVVACAGALAFIVLYNLTNINITERVREIATVKVLGFYQNEVASYVFREINILSVLGGLAGLLMGKALHAFVMSQIQIDAMYFPSRILFLSYILALCITMVFTFGISMAMRPKLHRIDMAESLKSIE